MALEDPPGVLAVDTTSARVQRHTTQALAGSRQGVCSATAFQVQQKGTPGMGVRILPGLALVNGVGASSGAYSVFNDANDETTVIAAGHATLPRNDLVCVGVQDHDEDGSSQRRPRFLVVQGTPNASPVDPAVPAGNLALARVRVDALESTSIVTADITDLRVYAGDYDLARRITDWTSYTPTLAANGWALGAGTISGHYSEVAKTVHFGVSLTFGAGMTAHATNWPEISIPVTVHSSWIGRRGTIVSWLSDTSAGDSVTGRGVFNTQSLHPFAGIVGGSRIRDDAVVSTNPWTWASGDMMTIEGWYRAA